MLGATGVGITPVLPMIDELLARPNEHGRVRLYWGNRSRRGSVLARRSWPRA